MNMQIVLSLDCLMQQTEVSSVYLAECDVLESFLNCYYPWHTLFQPIWICCQCLEKGYLQRGCQERFSSAQESAATKL